MKRFEPFETTADIGLKIYGKNLIELFENSALGMFSLIVDSFETSGSIKKKIEITGSTDEDILISLLSELIFMFETDGFILKNITGLSIDSKKYGFTLIGEYFSSGKHELLTHIKAVTYHNLEIKKGETFTVEIVFDV